MQNFGMESPSSRPSRPTSRQSIAHVPSWKDLDFDKENATADLSTMRKRKPTSSDPKRKNLRSKSLGLGGLEALKESAGNATKVKGSYGRVWRDRLMGDRHIQHLQSSQS